jgi:transcriptional regulator with XRE-family HTH domain
MDLPSFLDTRRLIVLKSLAQVAAECHIPPAELARYVAGECLPPPDLLPRLAAALEMGPRILARMVKESQAGSITPASIKSVYDRDRHRARRLARSLLAQPDTRPQEQAVCQQILGHWVHARPLRWHVDRPQQEG